ncbi:MAG: dimethyl sulfoxide reductase anchor subunit [Rhizobiaceae bacterium]|nr:dimethyl sulfoxide reductase anchor subunit [Rhizobiaceae bacterium]
MHPALSVISFTTLSGAGYGLAFVLATGHGNPGALSTKIAWFVALALITIGFLSSTLHLGNPQRAWRAVSQWKSSWLSREGCMCFISYVPLCLLAGMSIFYNSFDLTLGYIGAICCAITVYCTAMIYASLRTIASWHTGWTPAFYLAFALTGGTLIYVGFFGPPTGSRSTEIWIYLCMVFLVCSWAVKYGWSHRAERVGYGKSTMESATGLGNIGKVRLLERPHAMGNYLTNEMAFRIGRKHAQKLNRIALLLGLVLPLILLALALQIASVAAFFTIVAALSFMAGVFVDRWLFFATARHAVGLYYGGDDALMPAE